jgi:hypothetical protein
MVCPRPWPRPPPRGAAFAEDVVNVTAAKQAKKNMSFAFMVLKYSLLTALVRLSGCGRDCAANRQFKFEKRRQLFIRSHDAGIRVYNEAGNVIETHEHVGDFKEW